MKNPMKFIAAALAAAAIGGTVALAPIAAADTQTTTAAGGASPLVPYGTNPDVPFQLGYVDSNHDEADTTSNSVDLPF